MKKLYYFLFVFIFSTLLFLLYIDENKKATEKNVLTTKMFSNKNTKLLYVNKLDSLNLIYNAQNQPNPLSSPPVIFYSPHQDDETIGMGASIAEHVRIGRPVYVVLLTNGANENMLNFLKSLNSKSTMQDVINARNNEFIAACKALGVHKIYIADNGKGYNESIDISDLTKGFMNTMKTVVKLFPNASHKTVSGNCDSYSLKCEKMSTHQAASNAIHKLYDLKIISDIRLYRIYYYYGLFGNCDQHPSWIKPVSIIDKIVRKKAINEYKFVDTTIKRYGLGYYHSVSELFINSWDSNYEYIDYIENDYINNQTNFSNVKSDTKKK